MTGGPLAAGTDKHVDHESLDQTPLVLYTLALTLTPGPSALLIAASGARFGLARSTPHLAGSLLGCELQLLAAALGIGTVVVRDPAVLTPMQLASTAYLLWLGWHMLGSRPATKAALPAPLTWQAAAALQLATQVVADGDRQRRPVPACLGAGGQAGRFPALRRRSRRDRPCHLGRGRGGIAALAPPAIEPGGAESGDGSCVNRDRTVAPVWRNLRMT